MSTAERPLIDILQDRRYWIIHSITIPSLFIGGVIFVLSGFVYKLFGALNFNNYFDNDNSSISLVNDRFSVSSSIDVVNTEESEFSRLVKEERTGPGWKHSRQKLPRQTVVG